MLKCLFNRIQDQSFGLQIKSTVLYDIATWNKHYASKNKHCFTLVLEFLMQWRTSEPVSTWSHVIFTRLWLKQLTADNNFITLRYTNYGHICHLMLHSFNVYSRVNWNLFKQFNFFSSVNEGLWRIGGQFHFSYVL